MFKYNARDFLNGETYVNTAEGYITSADGDLQNAYNICAEQGIDTAIIDNCKSSLKNCGIDKLIEKIKQLRTSLIELDESFSHEYSNLISEVLNQETDIFDLNEINTDGMYAETSNYNDFTDYQYNRFGMVLYYCLYNSDLFEKYKGKTLGELSNELLSDEEKKIAISISNARIEDFVIVDLIRDEYDNVALLILKDGEGNYVMCFPPTINPSGYEGDFIEKYEDTIYDGLHLLGLSDNNPERDIAALYAIYYYQQAEKEGKQINFYGYSKGGGLAEFAYLTVATELAVDQTVLNKIVVYNPYHDNLNQDEVDILKESGDLIVYRNQGDFVSCIFNENDFDTETIFVDCNWVEKYNVDDKSNWLSNLASAGIIGGDLQMYLLNNDNFSKIIGGPHGLDTYSSLAFDREGNSIYNPDSYLYTGDNGKYDSLEVEKFLFGVDIELFD